MVGAIAAAHLLALWGLLQVSAVREALLQAAPLFVDLITPAPPAPPPPRPVPPPPQRQQIMPRPLPLPLIAAPPTAAPAPFEVAPAPPPVPLEPVPAPVAAVPAPAAQPAVAPAPPPPPKVIPASALQFTEPPVPEYPRLSRRNSESGLVVVRAFIDATGGAPRAVQVEKTSGFVRLDQAAVAAVQKARFKPYIDNGRPTEAWALVPLNFELEK